MRVPTRMVLGAEFELAYPVSVGVRLAVTVTDPRRDGFQLQEAESAFDCLPIHPGIFFPFAKKVTFPSVPATPNVAVKVIAWRKVELDDPLNVIVLVGIATPPPIP